MSHTTGLHMTNGHVLKIQNVFTLLFSLRYSFSSYTSWICCVLVSHAFNPNNLGGWDWRIRVQGQPDPIVHEDCISKRRRANWTRGVVLVREAALSSNSIPPRKIVFLFPTFRSKILWFYFFFKTLNMPLQYFLLCIPICSSFLLFADPLEVYLWSHWLCLYASIYFHYFLKLFQNFRPYLKVLNLLWLDICMGEGHRSSFSFLFSDIQLSQEHLLKRLFLHHIFWVPMSKIR
jgi:hypothetical protein